MCTITRINRDAVPEPISIEFERDASLRATEVLVINSAGGHEQGVKLICYDNGDIGVGKPADLMDGVDIV